MKEKDFELNTLALADEIDVDVYIVSDDDEDSRLDFYIASQYRDISRSYIQKFIKEDRIRVNSKIEKASYKVKTGDKIEVNMPEPQALEIEPQDIGIDIVYEDDYLMVVNKQQGMVVHPAPGNPDRTLVNAVLFHCGDRLSSINGVIRPGIVHRIDKNTSGLLVIAKDNQTHQGLSDQFKVHSITREYEMICIGNVEWQEKTIDGPIGRNPKDRMKMAIVKTNGKRAVTHFRLVENYDGYSHLSARLETGRTHQIRVHISSINRPILGDNLYGYKVKKFAKLEGQCLHARKLGFIHPISGKYMEFDSDLPEYFEDVLNKLR